MAAALVELAGMHGLIEDGYVELGLRLPQEQLGAMLGVTRQSVNRVLRALERRDTIRTDYNRITIRDFSALCDVAARRG
jgi:CRP/FNR family cyclic AMP-dependent transcriptional regulator